MRTDKGHEIEERGGGSWGKSSFNWLFFFLLDSKRTIFQLEELFRSILILLLSWLL